MRTRSADTDADKKAREGRSESQVFNGLSQGLLAPSIKRRRSTNNEINDNILNIDPPKKQKIEDVPRELIPLPKYVKGGSGPNRSRSDSSRIKVVIHLDEDSSPDETTVPESPPSSRAEASTEDQDLIFHLGGLPISDTTMHSDDSSPSYILSKFDLDRCQCLFDEDLVRARTHPSEDRDHMRFFLTQTARTHSFSDTQRGALKELITKLNSFEPPFCTDTILRSLKPKRGSIAIAQPNALLTRLKRHQLEAIHWMAERENSDQPFPSVRCPNFVTSKGLNGFRDAILGIDVNRSCPIVESLQSEDLTSPPLRDEMGLGKTLTTIGLIAHRPNLNYLPISSKLNDRLEKEASSVVHNKRMTRSEAHHMEEKMKIHARIKNSTDCRACGHKTEDEGSQFASYCDKCASLYIEARVSSKATLVICPTTIQKQWAEELKKHLRPGGLKYLIYRGIRNGLIHPIQLAEYDIVVTCYDVMNEELNNQLMEGQGDQTDVRNFLGTPLKYVDWYRCIIDECQTVESTNSKTAKSALRLSSHIKWCVSGTPLRNGELKDLYGLFLFIGLPQLSESIWWKNSSHEHEESINTISHVMRLICWRNTKSDVEADIVIPKQSERVVPVVQTSVEKIFYQFQKFRGATDMSLRQIACHFSVGPSAVTDPKMTRVSGKWVYVRGSGKPWDPEVPHHLHSLGYLYCWLLRHLPQYIHDIYSTQIHRVKSKDHWDLMDLSIRGQEEIRQIEGDTADVSIITELSDHMMQQFDQSREEKWNEYEIQVGEMREAHEEMNEELKSVYGETDDDDQWGRYIWPEAKPSDGYHSCHLQLHPEYIVDYTSSTAHPTRCSFFPSRIIWLHPLQIREGHQAIQTMANDHNGRLSSKVFFGEEAKCLLNLHKAYGRYVWSLLPSYTCDVIEDETNASRLRQVMSSIFHLLCMQTAQSFETMNGAKMDSVGRKLEKFIDTVATLTAQGSKVIVASEWNDTLDLLASTLDDAQIPRIYAKGKSKIAQFLSDFKKSEGGQVLLLPMKLGSSGLNLIEATKLLLYEPSSTPGDELQVFGRIYRMGQTRETQIVRMFTRGTIEETLYVRNKEKSEVREVREGVEEEEEMEEMSVGMFDEEWQMTDRGEDMEVQQEVASDLFQCDEKSVRYHHMRTLIFLIANSISPEDIVWQSFLSVSRRSDLTLRIWREIGLQVLSDRFTPSLLLAREASLGHTSNIKVLLNIHPDTDTTFALRSSCLCGSISSFSYLWQVYPQLCLLNGHVDMAEELEEGYRLVIGHETRRKLLIGKNFGKIKLGRMERKVHDFLREGLKEDVREPYPVYQWMDYN
ncbi:E3 ubiquitin-protein ligase SHPRH [Planoprotostelium fungivorum]|uniref:E3 ubiquitin-protein ligase SHPRH n=1 Tax=Planoprotostelium fungivorum TaxID=1890364 RepID=A0A2P6MRX8_9EUKA|nr:E3 ubiquitin-protein ligase SHPRH [Planoprotostelium fungivorum]